MQPIDRIGRAKLLPVIRTPSADDAITAAHRLVAAGLDVVEITTTIPGWPDVLARLREDHPDVCLGVGTILDPAAGREAIEGGAQFLVSPRLAPDVRPVARAAGTLLIEAGLTPTEVYTALEGGVAKLFPSHSLGPGYLRAILAVAPGARIIPTGGIPLADAPAWLDAGAYAVGVGRDLYEADDVAAVLPVVH